MAARLGGPALPAAAAVADQKPVWAVHVLAVDARSPSARPSTRPTAPGSSAAAARRPTRRRSTRRGLLSGTTGPVLDPIFSLRRRVRLEPGASATVVAFTTAVADTREEALALADQYHDPSAVARAFELAWAHSQVEQRHRNWSPEDAHLFQRLAAHVLFAGPALRAAPPCWPPTGRASRPCGGTASPATCRSSWSASPRRSELALARQLLAAHAYLRLKGLEVDLVLLNEQPTSDFEELHQQLLELVRASDARDLARQAGRRLRPQGGPAAGGGLAPAPGGGPRRPRRRPRPAGRPARPRRAVARTSRAPGRDPEPGTVGDPEPRLAGRSPVRQRTGRVHARRPRVLRGRPLAPVGQTTPLQRSTRARVGPDAGPAARPLDQRRRQPRVRLPRLRGGLGLHLGRQQPGEPPDALEQRPGLRPARRGRLPARRGDRRGLVADAPARPLGCGDGRSGTARATRSSSGQTHGLAHELLLFVPPEDPVKLIRLKVRNAGGPAAVGSRRPSTPSGCWGRPATPPPCTSSPRSTPRPAPCWPATRSAPTSPRGWPSPTSSLRPRTLTADRAEFLGRQRLGRRARRAGAGRAVRPRRGRRATPARRSRPSSSWRPARRRRSSSSSARPTTLEAARDLDPPRAASRAKADAVFEAVQIALGRGAGRRAGADARPRHGPAAQPLAALPGPELPPLGPLGVLPVGRRVRLPRPAPGRDGPGLRRAGRGAGPSAPRRGAAVPRRRRAALVAPARPAEASAPASPTTSSGSPSSSATTSTTTGDTAVLDERVPYLKGHLLAARPGRGLRAPRDRRASRERSTSTACGPSSVGCSLGRTACR